MNRRQQHERASALRILFLVSAHNGLSQRAWIALTELGHAVEVAVVDSAVAMEAAVREHQPELIVCPFLKKMIPESIWSEHRCLVVHPGPPGDRGPSSLDWAIELGVREWGVTVLEANGQYDAGEVWATRTFAMRGVGKNSLYRHEVRRVAIKALVEAVGRIAGGADWPQLSAGEEATAIAAAGATSAATPIGAARPLMGQDVRAIDWDSDTTGIVVRKVRAGEGHPGVLDEIDGTEFHLFGAHPERVLSGRPGEIIAQRGGAICRATVDGGVWITHLKRADSPTERFFKLPAMRALARAGHELEAPEIAVALDARWRSDQTYREIAYEQHGAVGYLHFDFYNGAMCTEQCLRLREAYAYARSRRESKVIVLMGGRDYFSNGIHLNVIEAAEDPAGESWRNLNAIDDLVRDIIETDSHLVISALGGDAAAGGLTLALAADEVYGREDIVLNPYYQHMGGLFGSEYWTYLMPRRIGVEMTARITGAPFDPVGARRATQIGLLDAAYGAGIEEFHRQTREHAGRLATDPGLELRLEQKRRRRAADEHIKPLQAYRDEEMARSYECFFGPDRSYHQARQRFAYKLTAPKLSVVRTEPAVAGAARATGRAA